MRSNDKKILESRDFYRIERDAQPEATGIVLAVPAGGQPAVESLGERDVAVVKRPRLGRRVWAVDDVGILGHLVDAALAT